MDTRLSYFLGEVGRGIRRDVRRESVGDGFLKGVAMAGYRHVTRYPTIPTASVVDLIPASLGRDLTIRYQYGGWNIDATSLVAITAIASGIDARSIFEFGTYTGVTTRQLASACPSASIVTIDLPPTGEHFHAGSAFAGTEEAARITQILADSTTFDFSPYQGSMDLVFVDAGHDYELVRADSEHALEIVRPGGWVVWDDYTTWPEVRKCINEIAREHPVVHVEGTRLAALVAGTRSQGPDDDGGVTGST